MLGSKFARPNIFFTRLGAASIAFITAWVGPPPGSRPARLRHLTGRVAPCLYGGASRTPVAEGGGALWKARRSISPREKSGEKTQCGQCATRSQRPWMSAAGRPVTRLGAVPRAIAPPMASKDRNEEQRPPLLRREARVPMPGPRCAATRTSLLHTSLLHCSRDSRPVRLRSVPGQRRRSPVCGESRASPSARSWPPSGKCCPGLRSRTTSTSLARRAE